MQVDFDSAARASGGKGRIRDPRRTAARVCPISQIDVARTTDPAQHEGRVYKVRSGRVTRVAPFGALVELEPGIEGLIPLSETGVARDAGASQPGLVRSPISFAAHCHRVRNEGRNENAPTFSEKRDRRELCPFGPE
jgi:hypothetical protein